MIPEISRIKNYAKQSERYSRELLIQTFNPIDGTFHIREYKRKVRSQDIPNLPLKFQVRNLKMIFKRVCILRKFMFCQVRRTSFGYQSWSVGPVCVAKFGSGSKSRAHTMP